MWGIITILIGLVYGWASPGRQKKTQILKTGFMVGLVLAIVLALISYATGSFALGVTSTLGFVGLIIDVLVLTLLFILGVWIGDMIEGRRQRRVA